MRLRSALVCARLCSALVRAYAAQPIKQRRAPHQRAPTLKHNTQHQRTQHIRAQELSTEFKGRTVIAAIDEVDPSSRRLVLSMTRAAEYDALRALQARVT